jgi:formate dehydrogenase
VHPDDAAQHGIEDGVSCRIVSANGAIELPAKLTDEVSRGTIAVPHGWGHRGGWQRASEAGGANVNLLASSRPEDLERLAGMAHLNGIPVRLEAVASAGRDGQARAAASPGQAGAALEPDVSAFTRA